MRMAYVITEMSALTTNITFSHLCTSQRYNRFLFLLHGELLLEPIAHTTFV